MVHGVSKNADLDPGLLDREIRPFRHRIGDFFSSAGGIITMAFGVMVIVFPFVGLGSVSDVMILLGALFLWLSYKHRVTFPLRRPMDPNEPDPKTKKIGDGIMLLGRDKDTQQNIWISNDDARTHMLVFGSTGSGKTRFLLSLFYQALLLGSGVMYVDGKGDTTVFGLVFSMCRRLGREDDLMIINYLTGSKSGQPTDGSRLSNTNNPFAYGPAETLRSLIVSLMADGGGDDMWKGRASALLGALLETLTYLRDRGDINLDVDLIRSYMPLDKVVELAQRDDINQIDYPLLGKYLSELPGYSEQDALDGDLSPKCYEQHGYLIMQLSQVLSELGSTYKHIFGAPLGEVDYKDLVYNRRILFVMLPALEKDPDSLSGLGKLVVAGVRSALAPALGEKVEGSHAEVIEAKPTNSNVPFLLIMDEYGYYSVKGFSVVAAQARSLGMSVVFAGQDFPSFKKGSEDEAKSVVANTNVKIFMKLEDQGETLQLAVERGGEGETVQASGHEMKGEFVSAYRDNQQTRAERRKRINIRDLVNQKPGEAHVMFGDSLFRCDLLYTEPNNPPEYRINRMLMVNAPSDSTIKKLHESQNSIKKLFEDKAPPKEKLNNLDMDEGLRALFNGYDVAISRKQDPVMASQLAFGLMEHEERLLDEDFVRELKGEVPAATEKAAPIENAKQDRPKETRRPETPPKLPEAKKGDEALIKRAESVLKSVNDSSESSEVAEAIESSLPFVRAEPLPDDSIRAEAANIFSSLSEIIRDEVHQKLEDPDLEMSPYEKERAFPTNQLKELEMAAGRNEEEAMSEAIRGMKIIDDRITYPNNPTPAKEGEEIVKNTLDMMLSYIETAKQESK